MNENWNLLGHDWVVQLLQENLKGGRIGHAYLFAGPEGIGRRTLALRLAQGINCEETENPGIPCGSCRSCRLIENMEHPDLAIVQAEQVGGNLKVNQIRELQHNLSLSPYESKYRIALILRIEEANLSAANALLKTLEEPPTRVVMILTAKDAEGLLPTIVSRCELFNLRSLPVNSVSNWLQNDYTIPLKDAEMLAHISGGLPGCALRYLNEPELMSKRQTGLDALTRLISANRVERFAAAENYAKNKDEIRNTLNVWISFWRDILLVRTGSSVPIMNIDYENEIRALSKQLDISVLKQMITLIDRSIYLLNVNANTRLTLEVLMLDLPYASL